MILSRWPNDGECFRELDDAVMRYQWEHADPARPPKQVVFNANQVKAPAGSVIFNTDLVGIHCNPRRWAGHEVWDFCERNIALYPSGMPVRYVPIGYHPSMVRFDRAPVKDIDLVFVGAMNWAREQVLEGFRKAGKNVVAITSMHGRKRDGILARAKLALNMLFYRDGVYPTVRAAHLVANGVPMLNELAPEMPAWAGDSATRDLLVAAGLELLRHPEFLEEKARELKRRFVESPMVLP